MDKNFKIHISECLLMTIFAPQNSMNLAVDIGNTKTKMGLFKGGKLLWDFTVPKISPQIISGLLKNSPVERAIISDVTTKRRGTSNSFAKIPRVIYLNSKTRLPFVNKYKTPSTL